jgi:hypothetical protein
MEQNNEIIEQTEQQEPKEKKKCTACEMDGGLLTAYGAARTACELMEDEKQQKSCREWAELLDPEKVESEVELIKQTLRYPEGPEALKKYALGFNVMTKRATIEVVEEMLNAKETVPEDLMMMFRQAIEERKV